MFKVSRDEVFQLLQAYDNQHEDNPRKAVIDYLKLVFDHPMTLCDIARIKIRCLLGPKKLRYADDLPIPYLLKDYLQLRFA